MSLWYLRESKCIKLTEGDLFIFPFLTPAFLFQRLGFFQTERFRFGLFFGTLTQAILLLLLGDSWNEQGISHCTNWFRYVISHSAYPFMSPHPNAKSKFSGMQKICFICNVSFFMAYGTPLIFLFFFSFHWSERKFQFQIHCERANYNCGHYRVWISGNV